MNHFDHHFYDRPSASAAELASACNQILARYPAAGETVRLRLVDSNADLTVPVQAIRMLTNILAHMATGRAVSITPVNKELTSQEAAELLNVSRPYLIDQLPGPGKLPFRKVGNRRKIQLKDVLLYKTQQGSKTDRIMAELATVSQNFGIVDP